MIKKTASNWADWPTCPQCQTRREAQCAVCAARGTDFRLADFEEPDGTEEKVTTEVEGGTDVLLLCSTCDEPFTPRFVRCCAECGFDFGDGIEPAELVHDELNKRAIFVIIGVAFLLIGLLGFFALVLQ